MVKDIGNVGLITIDPITAYMGKVNDHSNTAVRSTLGPLQEFARKMHVSMSCLTHPPKNSNSQRSIDQYVGSQAFIAAARLAHMCVPEMGYAADGSQVKTGRSFYTTPMHNLSGDIDVPTLSYKIESAVIGEHARRIETSHIVWAEAGTGRPQE